MAETTYPQTNLQPGATGQEVKQLQDYLVSKNYLTQGDVQGGYGIYGPKTTAAVAKLQSDLGVPNQGGVGFYGPKTRSFLSGSATPEPVNLEIPTDIPSNDFSASITNPITKEDIDDLILRNNTDREKIIGLTKKSAEETALEQTLADIRARADALNLGVQKYEMGLPGEGISSGAIAGRSEDIQRKTNLDLQTLGLQEKNLLTRLGLAKEARDAERDAVEKGHDFDKERIELYMKIEEKIRQEKNDWIAQNDKISDNARQILSTILTQFDGLTFNQLDPASQAKIQSLAVKAGIPTQALIKGMEIAKNEKDMNDLNKRLQIQRQQQIIAEEGTTPFQIQVPNGKGGTTTKNVSVPKAFWGVVDKARNELQQGETWGSVWNRVKAQFPNLDNKAIDTALGGGVDAEGNPTGWAKPGAFQEFKQSKATGEFYDNL
ncbi:MAG: adenosylhomocysteinase [Siphoviridae sp. cttb18]|nr:MAG: adenosylhomocysteinase [Siphoviridae sp. cttb18]